MKRISAVGVAALVSLAFCAQGGVRSDVARVCLDTRSTPYWHTVFSAEQPGDVSLDWPTGATQATLTIETAGATNVVTLTDTSLTSYPLPAVAAPENAGDEFVITLTLAYDTGLTLASSLGVVRGVGARSAVPVVMSTEYTFWPRASRRMVVPVWAGMTNLTLNAASLSVAPLNGDTGWAMCELPPGESTLVASRAEGDLSATVARMLDGVIMIVR